MSTTATDPLVLARRDDPYRADGELDTCDGCGIMIRWIVSAKSGKRIPVAPYPMPGNWGRPIPGYGEGRADGREPEKTGPLLVIHEGLAHHWKNPPGTVEGYRAHFADCPAADRFRKDR